MSIVISKGYRIAIAICSFWLILVFLFALNISDGDQGFNTVKFTTAFTILGLLPVALFFSIAWIRRANFSDSHCPECGSQLRFHSPKTGEFAGEFFLICNRYPQCKKIVHVNLDPRKAK
jgi:hypothetical protein